MTKYRYYATHISHRDYGRVCRDASYLQRNYATRIRNYAKVNVFSSSIEGAFRDVFGSNWYADATFAQLVNVAKLYGKYHNAAYKEYQDEKLASIDRAARVFDKHALDDSFYARAITKFYGKRIWREFADNAQLFGTRNSFIRDVRDDLQQMIAAALFIKKYAPKELPRLKRAKRYCDAAAVARWEARNEMSIADDKTCGAMPKAIREMLARDAAVQAAKKFEDTAAPCDEILANIRGRMRNATYRMTWTETRYRGYHAAKFAQWNKEYNAAKEFAALLDELQLVPDAGYREYRIHRGILAAMRRLAKVDVDLAAKQKTIIDYAHREYRRNRSRVKWVPLLSAKGEN